MRILRSSLLTLTVFFMASAVQAQQTRLKVNVPFDFYAGDHVYPSGAYTLNSIPSNDVVIRVDGDSQGSTYLPSNMCGSTSPSKHSKMVFHRMGTNYFLYQVWVAGNSEGRQFPISRTEQLLAQPETAIVAVNIAKK